MLDLLVATLIFARTKAWRKSFTLNWVQSLSLIYINPRENLTNSKINQEAIHHTLHFHRVLDWDIISFVLQVCLQICKFLFQSTLFQAYLFQISRFQVLCFQFFSFPNTLIFLQAYIWIIGTGLFIDHIFILLKYFIHWFGTLIYVFPWILYLCTCKIILYFEAHVMVYLINGELQIGLNHINS